MDSRTIALLCLVVILVVPSTASAAVRGSPSLGAELTDNEVTAGSETVLNVSLYNAGDLDVGSAANPSLDSEVTTARAVRVSLDPESAPVRVQTGTHVVQSIPQGQSATLPFAVTVADDASPGDYEMDVRVTYRYTRQISETTGARIEDTTTRTYNVELRVDNSARYEITDVTTDVRVGDTGTLALTMENVGAEAARDARVTVESTNQALTFGQSATGTQFVGDWPAGETRTIRYDVATSQTAQPTPYAVESTVVFENGEGQTRRSESLAFGAEPAAEQTFQILSTESTVAVDDTGTLSLRMRNAGPAAVTDATVTLTSENQDITFGTAASASRYVGAWDANETRIVEFDVTASKGADPRNYALQATVGYDDPAGDASESQPLSLGVEPEPEMAFELRDVQSSLRVGEERHLNATLVNTGERTVRDAVVRLTSENQHLTPADREYPVGRLAPGEAADVSFTIETSDSAEAGPRQFAFVTEYRTAEDETVRTSDQLLVRQAIAPRKDTFVVEGVDATVRRSSSDDLVLNVTNNGDETVTDVSAQLFANDPITVDDDEAFVQRLDPGESTRLTFGISAGAAQAKTYPLSLDFQYDDAGGDTLLSDTYRVPVVVTEGSGGGISPALLGAFLVVLIAGAVAYDRLYR